MIENGENIFSRRLGVFLIAAIFLAGTGALLRTIIAATNPTQVTIGNTTPSVTVDNLNGGNVITLTENTTTSVTVSFTVTDHNGCADVFTSGNVTTTVYRSGATNGSNCTANNLNCYRVSTSTHSCAGSASANATATVQIYYFADATDSSSSYPLQDWVASVAIRDGTGATSSATSTHRELNTVTGIGLGTSTINYGRLPENTDTSSTNQIVAVKNTGNSSATLQISGTALTSAGNSIATSSQHYATSTFTFGSTEQVLQSSATSVSGFLVSRPPSTDWATTTNMLYEKSFPGVAAYNNYLYAVGGFASASTTFAPINASGNIGSWVDTTSLPSQLWTHTTYTYNSYLYVVGGITQGNIITSTTRFAPTNATGSIGSWTETTALPAARKLHGGASSDKFIYVVGGQTTSVTSSATSSVLFASTTASGAINPWINTTALPTGTTALSAVAYNNYLYALGGISNISTSTVSYASINASGSVNSWGATTPLPIPFAETKNVVADSGIMYIFGGATSTAIGVATSTAFYAPIHLDGTLGSWSQMNTRASTTDSHAAVTNNGYAYVLGGEDLNAIDVTTVSYTPLASRNTYWGISIPLGAAPGTYSGANTFTSIFSP